MKKKTKKQKSFKSGASKIATAKWSVFKGKTYRPTWVEINQKAFISNIKTMRSLCKKNTKLLAVVKANAYGHMSIVLSKLALEHGADYLGVSSIEEGIELRENSIKAPILILGSLYPFDNLNIAGKNNLIPTISSRELLEEYIKVAKKLNKRLEFHMKVDTGMGRIGVSPKTALELLNQIKTIKEVKLSGIYTHFSSADNDEQYTMSQINKFTKVIETAKKSGYTVLAHSANSAASIKYKNSHFDMIRPGISLYGLLPFVKANEVVDLKPVLSWKTRIVFLKNVAENQSISYGRTFTTKRKSKIATLPVGYADGYDFRAPCKGKKCI